MLSLPPPPRSPPPPPSPASPSSQPPQLPPHYEPHFPSSSLCDRLRAVVSDSARVVCDGDGETFETAATAWNFRLQAARRPRAVLFPADKADVGASLRVAWQTAARVAVRNGGHAPTAHSMAPQGLTIDMSGFRRVRVRREAVTGLESTEWVAEVEGGAVWGDVYRAIEESGQRLYAVGGGCGGVGVSGLATAGGVAFSSRLRGLASDNVLEFTVVLPNGTVAVWSRASDPALHRAVVAGRTALGVIWSTKLRLWPGELTYGAVEFDGWERHRVESMRAIAKAHADNLRAAQSSRRWTLILESYDRGCQLTFLYVGTPDEARHAAHAIGLLERLANASAAVDSVHVEHADGERRSLLPWHTTRFRRLTSQATKQHLRAGEFLHAMTMLQVATHYNSSQAIAWWQSAAVDELGGDGWARVMQAVASPSPSEEGRRGGSMCHLQAEPLGGAINESPAWAHAPADSLLSFVCMSGGINANGRPWHPPRYVPEVAPFTDTSATAWITRTVAALPVSPRGAYAGYANERDSPAHLIGASGVEAVRRAQAMVDGAIELFGDVTRGWALPAREEVAEVEEEGVEVGGESEDDAGLQAPSTTPEDEGAHDDDNASNNPPPSPPHQPGPPPSLPQPYDLITGGTSGVGLATVERLVAAGRRVLLASHSPTHCATVASHFGSGVATCLAADLTEAGAGAALALAAGIALADAGPTACLRAALFSASPGSAAYNATLDSPTSRIGRVHFTAHRELLEQLLQPPHVALWCSAVETRVVIVGSGASQSATRLGVRALLSGAPYWSVPARAFDASRGPSDMLRFFADGGSGQLYASAKLLEELLVLEARVTLAQHIAAGELENLRAMRVLEAYPSGTVATPTAAAFVSWSHIATVSAAAAAEPIAEVLLNDDAAREAEAHGSQVPDWAMALFVGSASSSLARFIAMVQQ